MMMTSPFEQASGLHIGTVDYVSPDEIKVLLDIEAPESVALNAGDPRAFPRVNGYLLIHVDDAFLVGQVEWLTVERSPFPKRREMSDFGLVDLPYPLRKLRLNPLGTLRQSEHKQGEDRCSYKFSRGADALPSVGAEVLLPTEGQLRAIVESGEQKMKVNIGTSPLANDAEVCIDPNRLFGRHLAVLGNTGSGKSCSVAGLIRWCIETAKTKGVKSPNARFIILDPNGEYSHAFKQEGNIPAKIFKVEANAESGEKPLNVPLWFWNSEEWCAFTQASPAVQRPSLRTALREVKKSVSDSINVDENTPSFFKGENLLDRLNKIAREKKIVQYLDFLISRIETFLSNSQMKSIVESDDKITLSGWLGDYIGKNNAEDGCISIIDLSLVPTEVVHIVTSVIARMVFEALQRYMKEEGENKSLPTVLVMEEAHFFIKRYKDDGEIQSAANICCQTFERIAREGRKFGLGLVLSSQRPSELSATVLSQCNTFLVHRINNDRDQETVKRLVPDNLQGLFRELPSLPSQHAILLGWAAELPALVKVKDLPENHCPKSDDPEFSDVWTGKDKKGNDVHRKINWNTIANKWRGNDNAGAGENGNKPNDK